MTRPHFPKVIDATIMAALRSCPRKLQLEYIEHYKPGATSVHLHAGAAYASGLEAARVAFFQHGKSADESRALGMKALFEHYGDFQCPPESPKSLERMCGALEFYFERYPLETEYAVPISLPGGKRGIEFSFVEPLELTNPETGDPILYCGRMDTIVDYAGGVYGEDDKTASSLGASWPRQWDLRSQFTGYCWGAARSGIPLQGFLVRGVSILKTKYDTMEAVTYRPQWQIDRWYEQTHRDLERLIRMWTEGYYDYDLSEACNEYGGCIFRQVCMSKDPEPWLKGGFVRKEWDPILRKEILLDAPKAEPMQGVVDNSAHDLDKDIIL